MGKYYFLDKEKISSRYELEIILENTDVFFIHFMKYQDELIYIENNGKLYGVVSVGDLYRYYIGNENNVIINQNFRFVESINADCQDIFLMYKTIHEVPVVKDKIITSRNLNE